VAGDGDEEDDALAFVQGNLSKLGQSLPELIEKLRAVAAARGEPLPPSLPAAAAAAEGFTLFAEYLRRFGRADSGPAASWAVADSVEGVLALLRPELERHARVVTSHGAAPRVFATERQLAQIWLNLLVNAAQAIPAGNAQHHRIEVRSGSDERGWAIVDVEDSGPGIAPELLARIFDPFFSSKRGAGKGLGLPITRQIVAELGGELSVRSTVGVGSRFRVALPPSPEAAAT
jgi:signal transduction histidine kinase